MAGLTPIYGLRYAELADPPDGAALGKNLADDVEAELDRVDTAAAGVDARVTDLEAFPRVTAGVAPVTYNGSASTNVAVTFPAEWATIGGTVAVTATHKDDPNFARFETSVSNVTTAGATLSAFFSGGALTGYGSEIYWIAVLIP